MGHKTENALQVQRFQQLGSCWEKCGPMGCFASDFPTFLFHVNGAATYSERCLPVVQSLVCTYIRIFFPPPPLHWASQRVCLCRTAEVTGPGFDLARQTPGMWTKNFAIFVFSQSINLEGYREH